ncbi:ATPase F1 complex OSCP/delta subunit protein [Euphorbia peplus]|nr:ATPase F1 complex OSCP/delta subunit protein [Euphorbia peplus]
MEILTSSVSTLTVPSFPSSSSRNLYPPSTSHYLHLLPSKPTSNSTSNSTKPLKHPQISSLNPLKHPHFSSPKPPPTLTHTTPASGYAAALITTLQSNNHPLDLVLKDARRLSRILQDKQIASILNDPSSGATEKGRVVQQVGKIGGFNGYLVRLMKMLIKKKRDSLGLIKDVLVEFQRVCDELNGVEVVMVSTRKKMEEDEVLGVARRVMKVSGAVGVKVRNFVDGDLNLLSFAV